MNYNNDTDESLFSGAERNDHLQYYYYTESEKKKEDDYEEDDYEDDDYEDKVLDALIIKNRKG